MLHVASPFTESTKEDELIPPAVNGTQAVLDACLESGVKKCIITSSMVTVYGSDNIQAEYNETHFNPADGKYLTPYIKSKILAEKYVHDFRAKVPADSPLKLITIHPGLITGRHPTNRRAHSLPDRKDFYLCQHYSRFYEWQVSLHA